MPVQLKKLGNKEVEIDGSIFTVRVMDSEEEALISDGLIKVDNKDKMSVAISTTAITIVKKCLVGWSNVLDEDGKDITFDKKHIKLLPGTVLTKIADAAKGDRLPVEEEKN